jgi:hypothetical protein
VEQSIRAQDRAVSGGPQFVIRTVADCDRASSEMDESMARCRAIDTKSTKDCARCCRQLREGAARWTECRRLGWAPSVDWATIQASQERLACGRFGP